MSFRRPNRNFSKSKQTNEEEPPPEPSTSRRPPKKSQAKKSRDENRMESFRAARSERTSQQDKEALYEQLFFEYRNVNEAMKNLELNQSKRTLNLPISTRSCGFIIRNLVYRFVRLEVLTTAEGRVLAGSLYRIILLQIDYKLEEARAMQCSRNLDTAAFNDTVITGDMRRALDIVGANFSPIVNYIHAIGYVKTAAKSYLPRHPKLRIETSPFR